MNDKEKIIIDPEFSSLIPPLTDEEYAGLERSIKKEGCRDALVVWDHDGQNILIDGHNRYRICQKCGAEFRTVKKEFEDRLDVKMWMTQNQLSRRNLPSPVRIELAMMHDDFFKEKAQNNLRLGRGNKVQEKPTQMFGEASENKTDEPWESQSPKRKQDERHKRETNSRIAELAGVSRETVAKYREVREKATPEVKEQLRKGEKTINKAWQEIKVSEMPEPKKPRDVVSEAKISHKSFSESKDDSVINIAEKKEDKSNLAILYADIVSKIVKANERLSSVLSDEGIFNISLKDAKKYLDGKTFDTLTGAINDIEMKISRIKREIEQ